LKCQTKLTKFDQKD